MRVLIRYHLCLRISGISLDRFHIPAVQLELIGNAGVPEAVEDHFRQVMFPDQFMKSVIDPGGLHRKSERARHNEVIILILAAEGFLHFQLLVPVTDQHLRNGFRKEDLSYKCAEENGPVFVTKNGYGRLVVMDIEYYERTMQSMEEARMVNRGIDDYEKGNVTDGKSSLKKLREKHGI